MNDNQNLGYGIEELMARSFLSNKKLETLWNSDEMVIIDRLDEVVKDKTPNNFFISHTCGVNI